MRPTRLCGALAITLAAMGVLPGTSHAKANVVLVWPETKKPIEDGGRITLGEFFRTVPNAIPQCEAYAPATLQVNGKSVDDVSARAPTTWYECGAVRISGGFTQVELSRKGIMGIAQPPLAISEPGPCVYDVDKVRGSEDEDELAGFQVTGEATLKRAHGASHCAAEKQLDGVLGLYGPQSGGVGLLPWKLEQTPPSPSLEALEQYWADIGAHNFSAAYTYLALGTSAFTKSQFIAGERLARIQHVEFRGQLGDHGVGRVTNPHVRAMVEVVSLVTQDEQFGCRVWSGSYQMIDEFDAWRIKRASLTPRPCG